MDAIVAVFSDWGIGAKGTQQVTIKADRKHFREITKNATVIVGRRTLLDFPGGKPLKDRRNIVVSRSCTRIEGCEVAGSVDEAVKLTENDEKVICIGGAGVYKQFLPHLDRIYVTKIDLCPQSDSFFENLDQSPHWRIDDQTDWLCEDNIKYRFVTYTRIKG